MLYQDDMLTIKQKRILAAQADVSIATVERVYAGATTFGSSHRRIESTACELGFEAPPPLNKAITGWTARAMRSANGS
jgi:hypothetical protein